MCIVCEYYLSRHKFVESLMPDNSNLYIVSSDPDFANGLTEMTLFFLITAFTKGITYVCIYLVWNSI